MYICNNAHAYVVKGQERLKAICQKGVGSDCSEYFGDCGLSTKSLLKTTRHILDFDWNAEYTEDILYIEGDFKTLLMECNRAVGEFPLV